MRRAALTDEDFALILEQVEQLDDVRVLRNLQDFDFLSLLLKLVSLALVLVDHLNRDLLLRLLVHSAHDEAKLALSERLLLDLVVVLDLGVARSVLNPLYPLVSVPLR